MIVAQQFTAGIRTERTLVREADGWMIKASSLLFSAVRFTD
jgi:hypothetical protein